MAGEKKVFQKAWVLAALAAFFFSVCLAQDAAAEDRFVEAANGIVKIQSGFVDGGGTFREVKSGCGFLVSNMENSVYVITNYSVVSHSSDEVKAYCEEHGVKRADIQEPGCVRIVVKGDVTAEAAIVTKSEEQDYCVLSSANAVNEKSALKLGDSANVKERQEVFALGFPDGAGQIEFSREDVEVRKGEVESAKADRDGVYLRHSISVTEGMRGGPLLSANGYVIGLNCMEAAENGAGHGYALAINEIMDVLNNFSLYYGSARLDEAYGRLQALREECQSISSKGGYQSESMERLNEALTTADEALAQQYPKEGDVLAAYQALNGAKEALVPKTEKIMIAILVLAGCIFVAFVWLMALIVLNAKEKGRAQRREGQNEQGKGQQAGRQAVCLLYERTGQSIEIEKTSFVIGSHAEKADYCVEGNRAVSRRHAMITKENDSLRIADLGSLNGTYVNDVKLEPGEAVPLKSGDKIVLAGEAFYVKRR